ncbi:MAG TPA: tetratricopeptide repeat protein, partial [Thermoanaerobaculia bacterium]|nr:tetratricopeptide repeat protein [Thermoanaerobaculia bacterium]
MHPTIFELNAFGRSRLPGAQGRAVLRHLRQGCARCRAAISTRLALWLDEGPAAEARASDPRRHGRALVAEHLRAAARAFRAASKLRRPPDADVDVDQARVILEAEGPVAIGRMPRRLLGPPAIEALLHATSTLGAPDPRLRLRFAELAYDLAHRDPSDERRARELRCRAGVELANAHRVLDDLRLAQEELDRAREELLRGDHDPLVAARLLVIQALVMCGPYHLVASRELLSAAMRIYRRRALLQDLARASVSAANVLHYAGRFDAALQSRREALEVLDREREPESAAAAIIGLSSALAELGRWQEALDILRRERTFVTAHCHGKNASRDAQLEGRLLARAGDMQGAVRAFASSRGMFTAQSSLYDAGIVSLFWAGALEERGDWDGSRARIMEGTDMILRQNPTEN